MNSQIVNNLVTIKKDVITLKDNNNRLILELETQRNTNDELKKEKEILEQKNVALELNIKELIMESSNFKQKYEEILNDTRLNDKKILEISEEKKSYYNQYNACVANIKKCLDDKEEKNTEILELTNLFETLNKENEILKDKITKSEIEADEILKILNETYKSGGYVKSNKKQPLNKKTSNPHISNFLNNF